MVGRRHQEHLVARERHRIELRVRALPRHDGKVAPPLEELIHDAFRFPKIDPHAHVRKFFAEFGQHLGKLIDADAVHRPDTYRASDLPAGLAQVRDELVDVAEDALGRGIGPLPRFGELDTAPSPVEERSAQRVLERLDLDAQCRLGDEQVAGGAGETAAPGDLIKVEKVVQVDRGHWSSAICNLYADIIYFLFYEWQDPVYIPFRSRYRGKDM